MKEITRTIQFFTINWYGEEGEIRKDKIFFDDILNKISVKVDEDNYISSIEKQKVDDEWTFGVVAKTRKTDFPQKQDLNSYELTDLGLSENEGLYYPSHFGVFKGRILIVEFNMNSLRANSFLKRSINEYLNTDYFEDVKSVNIKPILRTDLLNLMKESKILNFEMELDVANVNSFKENHSVSKLLGDVEDIPQSTLKIGLSMGRKKSKKYDDDFNKIKYCLLDIFEDNEMLDSLKRLRVKYRRNGKINNIDLLNGIFKTEETFIQVNNRSKAINSEDAFEKFKIIYKDNSAELNKNLFKEGN